MVTAPGRPGVSPAPSSPGWHPGQPAEARSRPTWVGVALGRAHYSSVCNNHTSLGCKHQQRTSAVARPGQVCWVGCSGGARGGGGGRTVHGEFRWKVQERGGSVSACPGPARQGLRPDPRYLPVWPASRHLALWGCCALKRSILPSVDVCTCVSTLRCFSRV